MPSRFSNPLHPNNPFVHNMKKTPFTLAAAVCALFILSLTSCGPKTLLDETRTFQNDTWMRFTPEHYDIEAPNSEDCYNFTVSVTVDTSRYHEPSIPIMLEMESPNTEKRTLFSTLILRNVDDNWVGHFNDDGTMTVTQTVRQFYFFNTPGHHSVNLSQRTNKYEIHGIKALHFKVEEAKLEYPE